MAETEKRRIRDWWAHRPMTYGVLHGEPVYLTEKGDLLAVEFGSREFFDQVDKAVYKSYREFATSDGYLGALFPYERYRGKKVLEIGCGMGTMIMNWAQHGAKVTAVDLNPMAIAQTRRRFEVFSLPGVIQEMDATALQFDDASFDYVYSWGVLHHSPNLPGSLSELLRVLRPKGEYGIMLYNRASIYSWYLMRYLEGFLHGESRFLDPLALASRYTDGDKEEGNPHTWPVTKREMKAMLTPQSSNMKACAIGPVDYAFPPKVSSFLPQRLLQSWVRRWGWGLYLTGTKRPDNSYSCP
jgi:ubiquinone/menaquinone biosynthesis C-methylase UbiE